MSVPTSGLRRVLLSGGIFSGMIDAGDHNGLATLLNLKGHLSGGTMSGGQVWRNDVQPRELVNIMQPPDFVALTQINISKLNVLFQAAPIDTQLSGLRGNFQSVFSGTATLLSGHIMRQVVRPGSIIEANFGTGESVSVTQVQQALISG